MCGRFNATADPLARLIAALVGAEVQVVDRWNVAPTEPADVIRLDDDGTPELATMRWWLTPFWSRTPTTRYAMFNARSENLEKSRAFREPFRKRRAIVPITGFHEWVREGNRRLPWYMRDAEGAGLRVAGIWDRWRDGDRQIDSFAIVTTAVHPGLAFVHDRQPVLFGPDEAAAWLDPSTPVTTLRDLCRTALPGPILAVPVSSEVNQARNKDPRASQAIGRGVLVRPEDRGPAEPPTHDPVLH